MLDAAQTRQIAHPGVRGRGINHLAFGRVHRNRAGARDGRRDRRRRRRRAPADRGAPDGAAGGGRRLRRDQRRVPDGDRAGRREPLVRRRPRDALAHGARAARSGLGGHYVQGHVDGVGTVRSIEPEGEGVRLAIEAPEALLRYCVEKGSIAVEGVSLTIAALRDDVFEIALIPHTLAETTLSALAPGDPVNLEADVLAKYVERLVAR